MSTRFHVEWREMTILEFSLFSLDGETFCMYELCKVCLQNKIDTLDGKGGIMATQLLQWTNVEI